MLVDLMDLETVGWCDPPIKIKEDDQSEQHEMQNAEIKWSGVVVWRDWEGGRFGLGGEGSGYLKYVGRDCNTVGGGICT